MRIADRARRAARRTDEHLANAHLRGSGPKKLHVGCGDHFLEGWLNVDSEPSSDRVMRLDATKAFPFASAQFDYVFSEHMIEHVTYEDGARMLRECQRALKPGGKLRISTPSLEFLIRLYTPNKSALQMAYMDWAMRAFSSTMPMRDEVFVINHFVRAWGHRFIYDEKTLRHSLELAGFRSITAHRLNVSNDAELCNLENERRQPPGLLQLETMTLEATK